MTLSKRIIKFLERDGYTDLVRMKFSDYLMPAHPILADFGIHI